jgi:hypothetical protein
MSMTSRVEQSGFGDEVRSTRQSIPPIHVPMLLLLFVMIGGKQKGYEN